MLICYVENKSMIAKFYVLDRHASPFLDTLTSLNLGLIKLTCSVEHSLPYNKNKFFLTRETVINEYSDLFSDIGSIDGQCSCI
jgi:hypothetical protein